MERRYGGQGSWDKHEEDKNNVNRSCHNVNFFNSEQLYSNGNLSILALLVSMKNLAHVV